VRHLKGGERGEEMKGCEGFVDYKKILFNTE